MSTPDQTQPMPLPNGTVPEQRPIVEAALLRGIRLLAENAASDTSAAEAKDYAAAAKSLADALITLDPTRLQGGDTPDARKASVPSPPPRRDGDRDGQIGER